MGGAGLIAKFGEEPTIEEGEPWPHTQAGYTGVVTTESWHLDMPYMPTCLKASTLYGVRVVTDGGGETEFADLHAAYEALDESTKRRVENMSAFHSFVFSKARKTGNFETWAEGGEAPWE